MNMPVFCAWLTIICEWVVHFLPMVAYITLGLCVVLVVDALSRFIEKRRKCHAKSIHKH